MFDLISKKNWFFAFSLLITIPGLIFILLTPITGGQEGLKFSIDYTGGTEWSIRFVDTNVSADEVRQELVSLGQEDASDLRAVLRAGGSDQDLVEAIRLAVDAKPKGHDFRIERAAAPAVARHMSTTGG